MFTFDKLWFYFYYSESRVHSQNGQRVQPVGADELTESDVQVTTTIILIHCTLIKSYAYYLVQKY
jgi:hypothetical protein